MYQVPLAGTALSSANIGIETTITSGNVSCDNISATNGTINNLTTTIFNPASITTTTLDTENLVVSNTIPLLNVNTLNVSTKNTSKINVSNMSILNISSTNISATSITAPDIQPLLIAGTNISILNNVISAGNDALLPANANFSSITTTETSIFGGPVYVTDNLIVSDAVSAVTLNATTLLATNISTGEMNFENNLVYDSVTKQLAVDTENSAVLNSSKPVTSGALYNAINTCTSDYVQIAMFRANLTGNRAVTIQSTSAPAGGQTSMFYVDFYPKFRNSYISAKLSFSYAVGGFGTDVIYHEIYVGTASNTNQMQIFEAQQKWDQNGGGGTRSGAISNMQGIYQQSDIVTAGLFHRIYYKITNSGNDTVTLQYSTQYTCVEVTESYSLNEALNPNLYIGSGNVSCASISSSNSLTVSNNARINFMDVDTRNSNSFNIAHTSLTAANQYSLSVGSDGTMIQNGANGKPILSRMNNQHIMRLDEVGLGIHTGNVSVNEALEVVGNISCSGNLNVNGTLVFTDLNVDNNLVVLSDSLLEGLLVNSVALFNDDVTVDELAVLIVEGNASMENVSVKNLSVTNFTASNISTGSLVAGTNISILNNVISAYIEGGTDWNVSSIHVDNNVDIYGVLNVSETSTFEQSLNVENQLFLGKAGDLDGQLVLYSNVIGDNLVISNNGDSTCSIRGNGLIDEINFSLGGNQIVTMTPTEVNISGFLNVNNISMNASINVPEISTSEINLSDSTSIGQFTQINRQANRTFFVGNTGTGLGCDYVFYPSTQDGSVALEINRDLTTTAYRLNVATRMEAVNICTDNNISCTGSMTIGGNLNVSGTIDGNLVLDDLNVSEINNSTINTITANISGNLYVDQTAIFEDNIQMYGDFITLGDPNGGSDTELYLYSNTVGDSLRMAHVSETEFIFKLSDTNENMNFLIANASILTLDNSQARFHKNVNLSYTLSATVLNADDCNIELINASNMSADIGEITNLFGSNFSATDMNCSTLGTDNISTNENISCAGSLSVGEDLDVDGNMNVSEVISSYIETSDFNLNEGTGQYTNIYRSANQTVFVGNNNTAGSDYVFYPLTSSDQPALQIKRDLTTVIQDLQVVALIEAANICVDNNISCAGSMTIDNDLIVVQNVNISGTLAADNIVGIDLLNICSTNISTTNLSANETTSRNINCSTLTLVDTAGASGLDVTGVGYFRTGLFAYEAAYLEAFDNYFGEPAGTDTRARINFWSQKAATEVGLRFGCDSDDIVRLNLPRFGLYTHYNINISNTSTMDMDNTSTKFHQNVNISGTLSADSIALANICSTNISTSNLSTNKITFLTTYGLYQDFTGATNVSLGQVKGDILADLGATFSATTLNSSTLNSSVIKARNIYVQDLGASLNFSAAGVLNNNQTGCVTNLKTCNISTLNSSFLDVINASVSNDLQVDGILDTFDLVSDTGSIGVLDSTTANVSTLNASTINGDNLSTASMLFNSDFQFSLNTLSLAPSETSAAIQSATLSTLATQVDSLFGNFSTFNSDFGTIGGVLNMQFSNTSQINASNVIGINVCATNLSVSGDIQTGNISLFTETGGNAKIATTNFDFWLGQTTTGFTTITGNGIWLNSAVGLPTLKLLPSGNAIFGEGDVTITNTANISTLNTSNISSVNISATEISTASATMGSDTLTMASSKYLESISNYAYYYKNVNSNMTGTSHLVEFEANTLESALVTKTTNSRYTINRAGYYLVSSHFHPENLSINDRVCYKSELLKNGVANDAWSGDGFCYTRDDNFGEFGTCAINRIIPLAVDDYIEVQVTCKIGSAGFFTSDLTGSFARRRSGLSFQYLGS